MLHFGVQPQSLQFKTKQIYCSGPLLGSLEHKNWGIRKLLSLLGNESEVLGVCCDLSVKSPPYVRVTYHSVPRSWLCIEHVELLQCGASLKEASQRGQVLRFPSPCLLSVCC